MTSPVRLPGSQRMFLQALAAAAALLLSRDPSSAQNVDCTRLQAQIAALDQADAARPNPYGGQIQKLHIELERATNYGHSLGCDRQQFLFFGNPPPPQCGGLNAHIREIQASLGQLQAAAAQASNTAQRQDLVQRYNAYCRGGPPRERGFFETLFGGFNPNPPPMPGPSMDQPPLPEEDHTPRGGSQALCVKCCDGGFFPLNYSVRHGDTEGLEDLCHALCPNVEVSVYTRSPSKEIQTAVSLDGAPYTDLPNALKFQKSFDSACTCKPPGQSWAEALAGAERVLGRERKGDIIVTPEKSAEMSRPKLDPRAQAKAFLEKYDAKASQPAKPADDPSAAEALSGAQAPTASKDSAGIATGDAAGAATYARGQGQIQEVTGPDGVKRRVRIVGPTL